MGPFYVNVKPGPSEETRPILSALSKKHGKNVSSDEKFKIKNKEICG